MTTALVIIGVIALIVGAGWVVDHLCRDDEIDGAF